MVPREIRVEAETLKIRFASANWGILSPLEPWAGYDAQTNETGLVAHVWPMCTWFAPGK